MDNEEIFLVCGNKIKYLKFLKIIKKKFINNFFSINFLDGFIYFQIMLVGQFYEIYVRYFLLNLDDSVFDRFFLIILSDRIIFFMNVYVYMINIKCYFV